MQEIDKLPKAYDPSSVEEGIFKAWEDNGYFDPDKLPERNLKGEPYCIVFPPPNRTGNMHLGHAKTVAIEDILIRFHRMLGRKTYWVPGTDHAAISTQVKVEQILIKQGMKHPRVELGREKFLEKVREFAQGSRDNIVSQCKAMGGSMDWKREKYTLDTERNKAVNTVFKLMYEDGLIERGNRVVNWDPQFKTTLSDDEVLYKEVEATFITFTYDKDFPIAISTTRPETKFGDTAVAVHPDDERYRQYVGKTYTANFCGKEIKIKVIADHEVDPEFGTGALGVTPAHSMIDFEMALRHDLPLVQVIDQDAHMTVEAGADFAGLTTVEAREKIEKLLTENGCLIKSEKIKQNLPIAERGGAPVESIPMLQWWVRVNKKFKLRQNTLGKWKKGEEATLKELMRHAVDSGQTRMLPDNFEKIYFHWIDNLRDWCISRQIWFGHQVPVWYKGEDMKIGNDFPGEGWERDPDTLDTWFSSGMWTFSTLGWPDAASIDAAGNVVKSGELGEYHPTSVLETGRDIIFMWVARMILMTTYALGEVPFKDTYLHGLILDEQGRKMSKSLGNSIEPLEMIPKYGTDAVRLSLVMGSSPGMDQKLSEEKIKDFRNFTNKLWNISRFILMQIENNPTQPPLTVRGGEEGSQSLTLADRWILERLAEVQGRVTKLIQDYQFSQAGELLRDFTWSDLADWYLEIAKVEKGKEAILRHVLETIIKLWHPFMPFVTEYIWGLMGNKDLIVAEWPSAVIPVEAGIQSASEFETVRTLITDVRRLRAEQGVEPAKFVDVCLVGADDHSLVRESEMIIKQLARLSDLKSVETVPEGWATAVSGTMTLGIDVAGTVDKEKEKAKAEKEIAELKPYIESTRAKLANQDFISKAPEKVVQSMKDKLAEAEAKLKALE
ncbi:MAG: valine--tRNA ligase [Patescibacteria group bacterium]|nr:valine--tRNA ligase [Patescibacteria group bacterium]